MSNKNITLALNRKTLVGFFTSAEHRLDRYIFIFFLLLLVGVYGFVLLQISTLGSVQPNDSDVSSQVKSAAIPRIDPTAVHQMQQLQDNSVNVQSLFNQARTNPFQE